MKIAQIASPIESIPPRKYGGTERVIYALTEGLVKRGHDVTLFATADSFTSAKLYPTYPQNLRESYPLEVNKRVAPSLLHLSLAYQHASEFDIIHDHTGHFGLPFANLSSTPVLMTMHGPFTPTNIPLYEQLNKPYLVTISHKQKTFAPHLNHIGTVYNGLDFNHYPYPGQTAGYLFFIGRICEEKGVHYAIEVAHKLNRQLIIAAKLDKHKDGEYFDKYIEPHLSNQIQWIGEVTDQQKTKLFSQAYCTLHPVTWPEPFGLTLIESMACGCPVVAFDQGSIPEVINPGISGFVTHTVDQMIEQVKQVSQINRMDCLHHARDNFNADRMISGYEMLYSLIRSAHDLPTQTQQSLGYSINNRFGNNFQFRFGQMSGNDQSLISHTRHASQANF